MKRLAIAGLISLAALLGGAALLLEQVKVPADAIQSSVTRTTALIHRAWQLPVAATFGRSVSWQSNPSTCGAASLGNVFRSLGDGPTTEGDVLSGTNHCWFGICIIGLTLDELARVATVHTTRNVTILRDLTPEAFLTHLRKTNDPSRRYVVNFSRKPIFGAGGGHHSPIGGYLEAEDLVLVLDVNRKFEPWLVERSRLFTAINTMDGDTKRGLLVIE
jgi:hypothetical protein